MTPEERELLKRQQVEAVTGEAVREVLKRLRMRIATSEQGDYSRGKTYEDGYEDAWHMALAKIDEELAKL